MNVATKCPYISLLNWCYTKSDIKSKAESHDQIQTNYNSTYTARARNKKRKKPSALWLSIDLHSQLNLSSNYNNKTHERKRSATEAETEITQINLSYLPSFWIQNEWTWGQSERASEQRPKKKYMVEQITGILFSTSFWARTSSILKNIQITQFRKKTNGEWMYLAGDLSIVFYVVRLNE